MSKLQKLKDLKLLGCLSDSEITSENYKHYINGKRMSEWISVKDRLPQEHLRNPILMTYNDLVMEGEFANGKFYHPSLCAHLNGYCHCEEQEGITHWMPLPEPPKEKHS